MKLTLAEPRLLKESISVISDIVTETKLKITPDAVELVAMDPANVAMVIFKLLGSCFVEYDVKGTSSISMNLNNLKQVLRRAKPNDQLTLELSDSKLKITLKSNTTRTFYLPLIDSEEKEQKVPDLNFNSTVTTTSEILNDAIEDMDIIGESVAFMAETGKFSIMSAGDLSKAHVDVPADEETKVATKDSQKSKYSIEYLKKMVQGGKLADKVVVKFSDNYPLKIEYKVLNKLDLSFILAPRVDND
jgi:proliferating cell nuclear antigen